MSPTHAPDRLLVAIVHQHAFVRVQGRGSFKVSTALKQFALGAFDEGAQALVLDMAECVGMDSTFMGILAGLSTRLKQKDGGTLYLINLTERTRGLLATLGLDRLVVPCMAGETPAELAEVLTRFRHLAALDTTAPSQQVTAETMLEAHEKLVELAPENLPKFKDVLTYLREDLKKVRTPTPPGL